MPLKALLHNQPIVAPLLDAVTWAALRARRADLVLPCCPGVPVGLHGGAGTRHIQHFYHVPRPTCTYAGETLDHLTAKAEIARGCQAAGWTVDLEHVENDWRADVLTTNGTQRVAFEVQWSRQTLDETVRRQARYRAAGVRCYWLCRTPPRELRVGWDTEWLSARHDLPLFALGTQEGAEGLGVLMNGRRYRLGDFATRLLTRRIAFRRSVSLHGERTFGVKFYGVRCWNCRRRSHAYCIDPETVLSCCGFPVGSATGGSLRHPDHLIYRPEVVSAVQALTQTVRAPQGGPICMRPVPPSERARAAATLSFECPACHALFIDAFLREERDRAASEEGWIAHGTISVRLARPVSEPHAHWCDPSDGDFCASADIVQTHARP